MGLVDWQIRITRPSARYLLGTSMDLLGTAAQRQAVRKRAEPLTPSAAWAAVAPRAMPPGGGHG